MTIDTDSGAAAAATAPEDTPQATGGRNAATVLLAGLLAGLLLAGAVFSVLQLRGGPPADDSAEAGFLRDMSTHHAQAVEMSMVAHANSTNAKVVTLANDSALTQHGQIGYMQSWLREWNLSPSGSEPAMAWMPDGAAAVQNGLMPGMATPEQLATLRKATGNDLDVQFLTLMRQHHLGGIHMAQEILEQSDDKDVTWIANTMVAGQQGEIALIDTMLKDLRPAA